MTPNDNDPANRLLELTEQLRWVNDQISKGRFRNKAVRSIKDGTVTEEKSHTLAMAAAGAGLVELGFVDIVGNFIPVPTIKGPTIQI